jgi:iron(III) transport system substrate-binding protein
MIKSGLTRRQALHAGAALASFAVIGPARAAKPFTPSDSLLEAARREGKITLYTATFVEVEQEVVNEFRKKFPFIRIEMIRAPGGQLITRVKTEAASGKLAADVLIHSDRGLTKGIEHIFADYAPPNAADYLPASLVSPKLWHVRASGARRGLLGEAGGDKAEALSIRRALFGCAGARRILDRATGLQHRLSQAA